MNISFYTGASGMIAQQEGMNIYSHNSFSLFPRILDLKIDPFSSLRMLTNQNNNT